MEKIDFLDERYYRVGEDIFYPSVTYILDNGFPKGQAFNQWLKDVGNNARHVAERAAEAGSKVHNACEFLVMGEEIEWNDKIYDIQEWKGIIGFSEFYDNHVERVIACENNIISDKYRYAGTTDLVCIIGGEVWIVDYKFGNAIYDSYHLQTAAYMNAWNEKREEKVTRRGILHLKAKTRGEKKDKIQGKGWQLVESKNSYEMDFDIFKAALNIHYYLEPIPRPKNMQYPATIKLKEK